MYYRNLFKKVPFVSFLLLIYFYQVISLWFNLNSYLDIQENVDYRTRIRRVTSFIGKGGLENFGGWCWWWLLCILLIQYLWNSWCLSLNIPTSSSGCGWLLEHAVEDNYYCGQLIALSICASTVKYIYPKQNLWQFPGEGNFKQLPM